MIILESLKALVYTAVFSLLSTPFDFALARAIGAIDTPKDRRRMHTKPTPRIGGISIFFSFVVFSLMFCRDTVGTLFSILCGSILIVILGIIDDCSSLYAKTKLTIQAIAVLFAISILTFYEGRMDIVTLSFAFIWILTQTNAHNFIDGLDGLCVGVSLTEAVSLGILFAAQGSLPLALASFVLGGACIGFFPFNARNAKIFMGDTGSTFLGFALGFLSLGLLKLSPAFPTLLTLMLIFSVPLTDITFAVIRRTSHGKSPFAPDRSHIHHLLADGKIGHKRASLLITLASVLFSAIGISVYIFSNI